jgi:hypothetical protein
VPGHELSGVVVELGYGTTGLTQAVIDWLEHCGFADRTRPLPCRERSGGSGRPCVEESAQVFGLSP